MRDRVQELRRVPASDLIAHPKNWRRHPAHQSAAVKALIGEVGFASALIVRETAAGLQIIDGHLRADLLDGEDVPVLIVDVTDDEAEMLLATLDPLAGLAEADSGQLAALLDGLVPESDIVRDFLANLSADVTLGTITSTPPPPPKASPRSLPLRAIFTMTSAPTQFYCCMAVRSGFSFGTNSSNYRGTFEDFLCSKSERMNGHFPIFVDNDYKHYDHEAHAGLVAAITPELATVRDIMTQTQCVEAGIDYFSMGQILDWAVELEEHSDKVIVIPKYDCLDKIPEHYVLGYSLPSNWGGTPVPLEAFQGRKIHILGGSWKRQREILERMGDDVVSIDNNAILKLASLGQIVTREGETSTLLEALPNFAVEEAGKVSVSAPMVVAFALSCSAIVWAINEITGGQNPAPGEPDDDTER